MKLTIDNDPVLINKLDEIIEKRDNILNVEEDEDEEVPLDPSIDSAEIGRVEEIEDRKLEDSEEVVEEQKYDDIDEDKHVHWMLPEEHDPDKEHIGISMELDKQTVLMTMKISSTDDDDGKYAKLMCLPVAINGIDAGFALVDQAATRALIRRTKLIELGVKYEQTPVHNHCVLSSSGAEIPITSRFRCNITSSGNYFGDVTFYVVENTIDRDICCDIVLGRVALATSNYPKIDTATGELYNSTPPRSLQCLPACTQFESTSSKKMILKPDILNERNLTISSPKFNSQSTKLERLNALVLARVDLPTGVKEHLMTHLVKRMDHFDIPVIGQNDNLEFMMHQINSSIDVEQDVSSKITELLSYLHYTTPDSVEENKIITELLTLHVPGVLRKEEHSEKDEIMESVEDIEFPFTAPPSSINDENYKKEKRQMIHKLLFDNEHLNAPQKQTLYKVLTKYEDIFSMRGENLAQTNVAVHEIDTGDTAPFRERLRPYSPPVQAIIDKEVDRMIKQGVLIPSRSPYASNLLLVRKPDPSEESGMKDRVCASFVRLNKLTKKDSYPLPNIQTIFDSIGRSKWFTTMDLLSGFWQVMIKPEHRHKTAVITARGLYEYAVMAFGLCNAPATFQRLMDAIVLPEYRDFVQTYIDDVLTHSITFEDHVVHLDKVLMLFRNNKLMVKLSKCKFAQIIVKFLGHLISQGTIKCNPEAVETIRNWKRPAPGNKQVTAVRSFLGMVGWYRRFIPNFSTIASPLYNLTKKNVKWNWTEECEQAFKLLIKLITEGPVLRTADPSKPYILHTDASDIGLGAILMQHDEEGHLHPIAFASKLLNSAQRNYTVTDRECLAIVWALEHFNTYVEGHKYTVITDHAALSYLKNTVHSKQRMHRLALKLQPYELTVEYKPGAQNYAADLLSRSDIQLNALNIRKKPKKKPTFHDDYVVDKIVDKRKIKGRELDYEYLVKWRGYDKTTWEPTNNLINAADAVVRYEIQLQNNESVRRTEDKDEKSSSKRSVDDSKSSPDIDVEIKTSNVSKNTNKSPVLRRSSRLTTDKPMTTSIQHDVVIVPAPVDAVSTQSSRLDDIKHESKKDNDEVMNLLSNTKIIDENCEECKREMTISQRYVHNYHKHDVPVPDSDLNLNTFDTDKVILKELQQKEGEFRFIYDTKLGYEDIDDEDLIITSKQKKILYTHEFVYDDNGILYCIDVPSMNTKSRVRTSLRVCLPKPLRKRVMDQIHGSVLSSHPGIGHMYDQLKLTVWWPSMLRDVSAYVQSCEVCLVNKRNQRKIATQPMSLPIGPWTHVAVDYIGPLPTTNKGNKYILTCIDRYTRMVEAFVTTDVDTFTTAKLIVEGVVCRHGLFDVLQSDRGSGFVSQIAANVYKQLGIKQTKTSSWHPQSNGVIERFNRDVKVTLKIFANEYQNDWDILLPYAVFAYNTAFHSGIQETPFYLNNGRDAKTIIHQTLGVRPDNTNTDVHRYALELSQKLYDVHKRVLDIYTEINNDRMEDPKQNNIPSFTTGDKIYLYHPYTKKGFNRKMTRRWKGPYNVIEKLSNVNYKIERKGKFQDVHVQRMRQLSEHNTSMESYEYDLTLANDEVNAINDTVEALLTRRAKIEQEKVVIQASKEIEQFELTNLNMFSQCKTSQ